MAKTKITVKTKIKTVTNKTNENGEHYDVKFTSLGFSEGQVEKLREFARGKEEITLTIEPVQENLPLS